jgi:hypothetical protein
MKRNRFLKSVFLILTLCCFASTMRILGQNSSSSSTGMAPLAQYLISDRDAEIALARSAAPQSISRDAEIYVLEPKGFEVAVTGKNGFTCIVDRSWMLPFDNPEFWNPSVRLPTCLNTQAARFHLPLAFKTTALVFAGLSKTQISEGIKTAYGKNDLPLPESGSMCYMMSKQQNFGPKFGNADPHLMFWFPQADHMSWGAEFPDAPVDVHDYVPQPITEFAISVSKWSDGTAATEH